MTFLVNALINALTPLRDPFHFHMGESGRPYVCEDPGCTSPGYDPERD